jgi:hypothetical protein
VRALASQSENTEHYTIINHILNQARRLKSDLRHDIVAGTGLSFVICIRVLLGSTETLTNGLQHFWTGSVGLGPLMLCHIGPFVGS